MKTPTEDEFVSILYLAYALPKLREVSEEAASLLEAAILECAVSLSRNGRRSDGDMDLEVFLSFALGDVETITPVGVDLLKKAIGSLSGAPTSGGDRRSLLH